MAICPNVSGKRAFESLELIFFENLKKFILPQSPLICEGIEEGSKMDFLKNMKNHIIHTSSMLLKTDSI